MREAPEERIVHEVDGIREADNVLPRWWLGTLYGTIAFAVFYWIGWQVLHAAPSPLAAYQGEKARMAADEAARLAADGPLTDERLVAMSRNAAIVSAGEKTFLATCAACHGQNGGGTVGPNLTDKYWIHGGRPGDIVTTIRKGWTDKGMPAWGPQLGEDKVREVAAYVLSLKGRNVAGGKAPQGEPEGS